MSKLKAYIAPTPDGKGLADYYLKSEADRETARQKRKRCLALAKWCDERIFRVERDYSFWRYGKDYAINFYKKWRDRWLAIADKLKEE